MSGFTPILAERIGVKGMIAMNMSPKAAEFCNGTVWEEWKERFPFCTKWIDDFPKGHGNVNIVQLSYV